MLGRFLFAVGTFVSGERGFDRRLRQTVWLERQPADVLRDHVSAKLSSTLSRAVASTPWYQPFRQSVEGQNDAWQALQCFPELTKAALQHHRAELTSRSYRGRVVHKTTGGSTGQPVTVAKDPGAVSFERAATWSFYQSYGIEIGSRCVRFWGTPTTANRAARAFFADLASNRITLSAFGVGDREMERHWMRCKDYQAPFFYGYSSMLAAFAQYVEEHGLDGSSCGVKAIVSTSEVMTEVHRNLLQRVFKATIRDEYGCGEFGPIAYECEAGLLHVASNNVVVEVITDDGRAARVGESGRLIVTDLNNLAMPLIRFNVGDFAELGGNCTCGRTGKTLVKIWGREYDFLELPDGRKYHGEFLMYLFEDLSTAGVRINQFQVIQDRDLSVSIRIVGSGVPSEIAARAVEAEARRRLPGVAVSCVVVEEIERRASGKTPLIIRRG